MEALSQPGAFGLTLAFPIQKADKSSRTVSGVATSEVVDAQGEILLYAGSKQALTKWAGNVREMHEPKAVGKAVAVECDDSSRTIRVTAYISTGAEDTWQKINEGVLSYFSVGGTRLRSEVRQDGVRVTSAWKCNELSLVDVGANPEAKVTLVKSVDGVPVATDLLRGEGEEETVMDSAQVLATRLDALARQFSVGSRPLPSEVSSALSAAGAHRIQCNKVAVRDWGSLGPSLADTLGKLSAGLRVATRQEDVRKIAEAASVLIAREVVSPDDRRNGLGAPRSDDTVERLYAETAEAIRKFDGDQRSDAYQQLTAALFRLGPLVRRSGTIAKRALSLDELREMEAKLSEELRKWNETGLPQNSKQYDELTRTFFRVAALRKAAERGR